MSPLRRFWSFLDSETVRGFQVIQYLCYLFGGIAMIATGNTPTNVDMALGSHFDSIWKILTVVGPLLVVSGLTARARMAYAGLWWQFAGDAAVTGSLLVYLISLVQSPTLTPSNYVVAIFVGLTLWSLLFSIRDIRRIGENELVARRS